MEEKMLKKISFNYNSDYDKSKTRSFIEVDYTSATKIEKEEARRYRDTFKNYLENNKCDDIVTIVTNIKEIFKDLKEEKLSITIKSYDHDTMQSIEYLYGKISSFCFMKEEWNDLIIIENDFFGTNIKYKKSRKYIRCQKNVNDIYEELNKLFEKIYKLKEFEEQEEKVKVKKYTN